MAPTISICLYMIAYPAALLNVSAALGLLDSLPN